MNRKDFLALSKSIILGLGTHQAFGRLADARTRESRRNLDDSYLVKGLTAMAQAKSWFNAHWGAAVIAGYYLCNENDLEQGTTTAIKKQLDAMIKLRKTQFEALPQEESDETLIERIPMALSPAIAGGLRAHGHAVIFASLSTKALRDVPHMTQPKLVDGLCGLSRQIAKKDPEAPAVTASYADTQAMVEATFDSLARFKSVLGRPSVKRPNFTHMVTHTEALMNLESMGYSKLARSGHIAHQSHIGVPVPDFDRELHPTTNHRVTLENVTRKSFWENEQNLARWNNKWSVTDNRNGYWVAFGHLFKVLYSYHRLIDRITDKDKVRLCSMILLERYLNPDVLGG